MLNFISWSQLFIKKIFQITNFAGFAKIALIMSQSVDEDDEFRLLFHINCSEDDKQHFLTFKDSYEELALKEVHCNICLNHIGTRDKENIVTHQFLQITICNACHEFYVSK